MRLCRGKVDLGVGRGVYGNKHLTIRGPYIPYVLIGYPHRIMPLWL